MCSIEKLVSEFSRDNSKKDKYHSCKECDRKRNTNYNETHKDDIALKINSILHLIKKN